MTASGILELTPADQVVTVRTSIPLAELREALREVGQDLPLADFSIPWATGFLPNRVGGGSVPPFCFPERSHGASAYTDDVSSALDFNLPHVLEGRMGTWRDWVLGGVTEAGTGLIGKSGARVVKSVAGYDVHRLLVGARGTLGRLREVHLRTVPAGTVADDEALRGKLPAGAVRAIVRVPHPDFARAMEESNWHLADPLTATLWTDTDPRWPDSKVWLPYGPFVVDAGMARLMWRAKAIFDPDSVLPPLEIEER